VKRRWDDGALHLLRGDDDNESADPDSPYARRSYF
jgi:hypothetical protein